MHGCSSTLTLSYHCNEHGKILEHLYILIPLPLPYSTTFNMVRTRSEAKTNGISNTASKSINGTLKTLPGKQPTTTDRTRWRLLDERGRQTWHYLRTDEEVKAWPQSTADKWFLGLDTVRCPSVYIFMRMLNTTGTTCSPTRQDSAPISRKWPHILRKAPAPAWQLGL